MGRCKKNRLCRGLDGEKIFKPAGIPIDELKKTFIELDEFEAIRLCDLENRSQIEASEKMSVSRATVQRLLQSGRAKIVDSFLNSKVIVIRSEDECVRKEKCK